jgi:hypothetical protein
MFKKSRGINIGLEDIDSWDNIKLDPPSYKHLYESGIFMLTNIRLLMQERNFYSQLRYRINNSSILLTKKRVEKELKQMKLM